MRAIKFMRKWLTRPGAPAILLVLLAKVLNLALHDTPAWFRVLANGNVDWAGAAVVWAREELRNGPEVWKWYGGYGADGPREELKNGSD